MLLSTKKGKKLIAISRTYFEKFPSCPNFSEIEKFFVLSSRSVDGGGALIRPILTSIKPEEMENCTFVDSVVTRACLLATYLYSNF